MALAPPWGEEGGGQGCLHTQSWTGEYDTKRTERRFQYHVHSVLWMSLHPFADYTGLVGGRMVVTDCAEVVDPSARGYHPAVSFLGSAKWVRCGVFPLRGPLARLWVQWLCTF